MIKFTKHLSKGTLTKKTIQVFIDSLTVNGVCQMALSQGGFGEVNIIKNTSITPIKYKTFIYNKIVYKSNFNESFHTGNIKNNNIIFDNTILSEIIIGKLINHVIDKKISNIVICLGMTSCDNVKLYGIYEPIITMESDIIPWDLSDFGLYFPVRRIRLKPKIIDSIIIQFLSTTWFLWDKLKLIHGDLMPHNVMISHINTTDADYFAYHVDDLTFYIKNYGFLIKIIDFGLSSIESGKYTIGSSMTSHGGMKFNSLKVRNKIIIDDKRFPEFVICLRRLFGIFGTISPVLTHVMFMIDKIYRIPSYNIMVHMHDKSHRIPNIKKIIRNCPSEYDILSGNIFKKYSKIPTKKDVKIIHFYI